MYMCNTELFLNCVVDNASVRNLFSFHVLSDSGVGNNAAETETLIEMEEEGNINSCLIIKY